MGVGGQCCWVVQQGTLLRRTHKATIGPHCSQPGPECAAGQKRLATKTSANRCLSTAPHPQCTSPHLAQQVCAADELVQGAEAQRRQARPHLLRHKVEVVDQVVGGACTTGCKQQRE